MKENTLLGGSVLLAGIVGSYLIVCSVVLRLSRDGFLLWRDASGAIQWVSTLATVMVAFVVLSHIDEQRQRVKS